MPDPLITTARNAAAKYSDLDREQATALLPHLTAGEIADLAAVGNLPEHLRADRVAHLLAAARVADGTPPFLCAVCCTYKRPKLLAEMLACYLAQDYPPHRRHLLILDDAGQFRPDQREATWSLVSTRHRFRTLGEKRNAAFALAPPKTAGYLIWDDDDLYLPGAFKAAASALAAAPWSRPSQVLHLRGPSLVPHKTGGLYQGGWSFRRDLIEQTGGYRPHNNGEDQEIAARLFAQGICYADPVALGHPPQYLFRDQLPPSATPHLSGAGPTGYADHARRGSAYIGTLNPADPAPAALRYPIAETVHPRPF